MNRRHFLSAIVILLVLVITGCKPTVPKEVIQPDVMEKILYDYHLAQGAAMADYKDVNFKKSVYARAVFKKYGITEAEFDSSMVFYMANTSYLHEIYKHLAENINNQVIASGSTAGMISIENASDTASIWNGPSGILLLPHPPYNRLSYEMKTDSSFHKGDNIILNFDSKFLWQDGMRDGIVLFVAKFKNDSIASRVLHVSSDNHYNISIHDSGHQGFKSISGCFFVSAGNTDETMASSTTKLMFINNISMVRMHEQKPKEEPADNDADAQTERKFQRVPDSVRNALDPHQPQSSDSAPRPGSNPQISNLRRMQ